MENLKEILILVFGSGGLISTFLLFRQKKRIKEQEGNAAEISNLKIIIDNLKIEIDRLTLKQSSLEERLNDKDRLSITLYRTNEELERKNHLCNLVINMAIGCNSGRKSCPVLRKKAELERVNKKQKNDENITEGNELNKEV